jgi:hypothetical protein
MPRVGKGTAYNKPTWNYGTTTNIRVPIALKDKIMSIARAIDDSESDVLIIDKEDYFKAIKMLENSLTLKANAGGAIKEKIREVLTLLS